jgi:hypothetical protein
MIRHILLLVTLVLWQLCASRDCESLNTTSAEQVVSALDHGDIKTEDCSRVAFQRIEQLPQDKAIPILIGHLNFKRPGYPNAPHGLRSQYPAIESLYNIGLSAEPTLIELVAQNQNGDSLEYHNALSALATIRHGDVVPTIKLLRARSRSLAGSPEAARLDSAARDLLDRYCPKKLQRRCEEQHDNPLNTNQIVAGVISKFHLSSPGARGF